MPAWMNQLGPTRVQAVVAYVLTLRNTDVTGKEPQGQPCNFCRRTTGRRRPRPSRGRHRGRRRRSAGRRTAADEEG